MSLQTKVKILNGRGGWVEKKTKRTQQFWEVDKYGVSSAIFYFARSSHSYIVQCAQLETQYTTVSKYFENLLFVPAISRTGTLVLPAMHILCSEM